jgi:hypothetical protein
MIINTKKARQSWIKALSDAGGRQVKCPRCQHLWVYTGNNRYITSCPSCRTSMSLRKNTVGVVREEEEKGRAGPRAEVLVEANMNRKGNAATEGVSSHLRPVREPGGSLPTRVFPDGSNRLLCL